MDATEAAPPTAEPKRGLSRYSATLYGTLMKTLTLLLFLIPFHIRAQRIELAWLNTPCANMLNCDTGCSACNTPVNQGTQFFGNPVTFLGVDVCPEPVHVGDNALLTYGWPSFPDNEHGLLITGIAFTPTYLDSVIIRHRSGTDGPQRMRVRFGINENMPATVLADLPVGDQFTGSVFTQLGTVAATETMVYGYFSLLLQPYQGNGGSWDLDELRIVGSAAQTTGVQDLSLPPNMASLPRFDALGRPILEKRGVRFYLDRSRRVILQ